MCHHYLSGAPLRSVRFTSACSRNRAAACLELPVKSAREAFTNSTVIVERTMKLLLARSARAALLGAVAIPLAMAGRASAQTGPMQMPLGWPMTWGMVAICTFVIAVLILGAAALVKYLFFR